jgi:hypothetical protein
MTTTNSAEHCDRWMKRPGECPAPDALRRCVRDNRVPPQLRFWLTHFVSASAEDVWRACPRFDWLAAIARACGYPDAPLVTIEGSVRERAARTQRTELLPTPQTDQAAMFRDLLSWRELNERATGLQNLEPAESPW